MNIYNDINIPSNLLIKGQNLCIGFFDGIHLGHKLLIDEMKRKKGGNNILTFSSKLRKDNIGLLLTHQEKMDMFNNLGIDKVFIIDFNDKIKNQSKDEFLSFLSKNELANIFVGKDFTFGKDKQGTSEDLKSLTNTNINVIDLLTIDNKKVSSTYIKELIIDGKIDKANQLLGYNYTISSNVYKGYSRGKKLGYPTINQEIIPSKVLPKLGVYKSNTLINGKKYLSITNIGNVPTFNNNSISIETHVINEKISLRVNYITIELISYLREEKKFKDEKELIKQLNKDKHMALSKL